MNKIFSILSSDGEKSIECANKHEAERLSKYAELHGFESMLTLMPQENKEAYTIWKVEDNEEESYKITYPHTEDTEQWLDAFLIVHGIDPVELGWKPCD